MSCGQIWANFQLVRVTGLKGTFIFSHYLSFQNDTVLHLRFSGLFIFTLSVAVTLGAQQTTSTYQWELIHGPHKFKLRGWRKYL